jgi:hypothetical protein
LPAEVIDMARRPQTLAFGILFAPMVALVLAFGHGGNHIWAALDPGHYDAPCPTASAGPPPILASAHAPAPVAPECEGILDDGAAADATSTEAPDPAPYRPTHVRHDHPGYGFAP